MKRYDITLKSRRALPQRQHPGARQRDLSHLHQHGLGGLERDAEKAAELYAPPDSLGDAFRTNLALLQRAQRKAAALRMVPRGGGGEQGV